MRIALVAGHLPAPHRPCDGGGGADPQLIQGRAAGLAHALAGLGHQVTIYARRGSAAPSRASSSGGVRTEYLAAGPAQPLPEEELLAEVGSFSSALVRRWRHFQPEVVHAHFWTSGLAALAAARELPVPVVQTFHSLAAEPDQHGGNQPGGQPDGAAARYRMEAVIARSVRAVLAGSAREAAALAKLGVPRASVTVVPAGVDVDRFGPAGPIARRGRRPRLLAVAPGTGYPDGEPWERPACRPSGGSAGDPGAEPAADHAADHGLSLVVAAMAAIPEAELVIAGGPPRSEVPSDPLLCALASQAKQLHLGRRLVITGAVRAARMPALLRSADLFVHLATGEESEHLPVQAMACGTPVVAAADAANSDAVVDGATGALISSRDPVALAHRIRQLLASPMQLQGYGIAAANRVRTRYAWERIGAETAAVYERAARDGTE
jgi:glycosyltransferase involved in cell wall biosynthesis